MSGDATGVGVAVVEDVLASKMHADGIVGSRALGCYNSCSLSGRNDSLRQRVRGTTEIRLLVDAGRMNSLLTRFMFSACGSRTVDMGVFGWAALLGALRHAANAGW